jgi:hypothetical protein
MDTVYAGGKIPLKPGLHRNTYGLGQVEAAREISSALSIRPDD